MTRNRSDETLFEFVGSRGYILSGRIERPRTTPRVGGTVSVADCRVTI